MSIRSFSAQIASLCCLALFLFGAPSVKAEPVNQPAGWGLGLMLGYPLGLNAKYWLGGPNAFDLAVGGGPGVRFHGDYEWGLAQVLKNKSDLTLDLYLGAGGAVTFASGFCGYYGDKFCEHRVFAGVRVPFGIDARLRKAPVDFGLEIAPGIWFGNYVEALFDAFLFVHFIF